MKRCWRRPNGGCCGWGAMGGPEARTLRPEDSISWPIVLCDSLTQYEEAMASQAVESKRTYCRICVTQCGVVVDVEDGQIVKVRGDREHPLTKGYTCPKGRAIGQLHHHPDAI